MAPNLNNNPTERRRPLSFSAVRPCAATSPSTLLLSLITLAQNICNFHRNTFTTQRRNARETARQISILLVLFQELHDRSSVISHIVRLCFTELHVTLQKIHLLMQDCAREDARLWMLSKSQHVATQFRALTRAIATALGTLPLRSINISVDVKELVELVTKQGKRGKLQLDQNDERETKRLRFILDQFHRGIEPDMDAIESLLDYLKIKSWITCNKEVKFLEKELELESNEQEVSLLSSLLGFLCYSRVTRFENLDFQSLTTEQYETRHSVEMLSCVVPEDFECPISLEIMTDPVTISSGQTYNRTSIQKWFKAGNTICPKTRAKLHSTALFPNTALKKLIQQFCSDNGVAIACPINPNRIKTADSGSPAAANAVQFSSWFLSWRLVFGTEEQKNKAAYEIRLLARSNVFNRACLVEMGTVPPLLDLLTTDDRSAQENAISALMKLSKNSSGQQVIIESRGLVPIINVLKRGLTLEARHVAAAVVFYLSSVKEYRKLIGENADAIPALVEIVKEGTAFGKKNAVVAIFGLLLRRGNHAKVLASGAVPVLVNVLAFSVKADLVTDSLAVLVAMVESTAVEGARAAFKAQVLNLVTGILQSAASRAGKEYCASILLALCVNIGAEVITVLAKDPSLMPSLYSLLTDGTPHAAKKARSLIRVLQEFSEKSSYGTVGSSVSRQR